MTNVTRRQFIKKSTLAGGVLSALPFALPSKPLKDEIRIGIIGLDTSHSPAFAKLFNAANPIAGLTGFKVLAAYPQGSADIQSSVERIPAHTKEIQQYGVEVVDSIKNYSKKWMSCSSKQMMAARTWSNSARSYKRANQCSSINPWLLR